MTVLDLVVTRMCEEITYGECYANAEGREAFPRNSTEDVLEFGIPARLSTVAGVPGCHGGLI